MKIKSLNENVNMTEGNTVKLLIAFSIPMLIGNLFQQLYNLVDSIVIGRFVGSIAFGAIGVTSSLNFLFFASILNTVLDVIFVKYLNLAVWGAGLATLISQLVSGILSLIYAIIFNPFFSSKKMILNLILRLFYLH